MQQSRQFRLIDVISKIPSFSLLCNSSISGRVDRASATEVVDSGSIPD